MISIHLLCTLLQVVLKARPGIGGVRVPNVEKRSLEKQL
jgi:hypothetical protein